jgi:acyl-CoA reductase-like NAD-dependent aldehyde dehydrogenase
MAEPLVLDMYVEGKRVEARSGERFQVLNPAAGDVYATVPKGGVSVHDIDAYTELKTVGVSLGAHSPSFDL